MRNPDIFEALTNAGFGPDEDAEQRGDVLSGLKIALLVCLPIWAVLAVAIYAMSPAKPQPTPVCAPLAATHYNPCREVVEL